MRVRLAAFRGHGIRFALPSSKQKVMESIGTKGKEWSVGTMVAMLFIVMFGFLGQHTVQAQNTANPTGWIMFSDSVAEELELRPSQSERLHAIDSRYRADHDRLGEDPRSDPNYQALTERRNAEIQTVLDSEQYQEWLKINDTGHNNDPHRVEPGPQSTDMDRRHPQGNQIIRDARGSPVHQGQQPVKGGNSGSQSDLNRGGRQIP